MPVFHSRGNKHFQVHPKTFDPSQVALVPEVIYSICKYIPEIWNPLQRKNVALYKTVRYNILIVYFINKDCDEVSMKNGTFTSKRRNKISSVHITKQETPFYAHRSNGLIKRLKRGVAIESCLNTGGQTKVLFSGDRINLKCNKNRILVRKVKQSSKMVISSNV